MRVSSVMCCSESNGTLKSTRTNTRFPARSISRIVFLFMSFVLMKKGSPLPGDPQPLPAFLSDEVREISNTAGVAPLVIVPGEYLDHVATLNHGQLSVDDRGMGIPTEIHPAKRLLWLGENAIESASRSLLERIVHGFLGRLFAHIGHEIDH